MISISVFIVPSSVNVVPYIINNYKKKKRQTPFFSHATRREASENSVTTAECNGRIDSEKLCLKVEDDGMEEHHLHN